LILISIDNFNKNWYKNFDIIGIVNARIQKISKSYINIFNKVIVIRISIEDLYKIWNKNFDIIVLLSKTLLIRIQKTLKSYINISVYY